MEGDRSTIAEQLAEVAAEGIAEVPSGVLATSLGELRWGQHELALGATTLAADELASLQVSRSSELVAATGLGRMLGREPGRVERLHVEVRSRRGERVRLTAEASPARLRGLPELRVEGVRVSLETALAVARAALALGATLPRFGAHAPAGRGASRVLTVSNERGMVRDASGRWGFVNRAGELVIPCQHDEARPFSEGFAAVRIGERWGYIDLYGKLRVPADFETARPFYRGAALARQGGTWQRVLPGGVRYPTRLLIGHQWRLAACAVIGGLVLGALSVDYLIAYVPVVMACALVFGYELLRMQRGQPVKRERVELADPTLEAAELPSSSRRLGR